MKLLEKLILAAGLATVGYLLWTFDPRSVWGMISQIGPVGAVLVLVFQVFDHWLNALGWRYAFRPAEARQVPLWLLIKARVAGDGVNYLTPSGSIAGELIRPGMIGDTVPEDARNSSVVVAKLSQAMGQALFILLGMVFVVQGKLDFLEGKQRLAGFGGAALIFFGVTGALWLLVSERTPRFLDRFQGLAAIRVRMRSYLKDHPGRYAASIVFFMLGYAWGALEVLLICHYMGLDMPVATALAVEILSNVVDSLMFMVPAKVGTQEAGKTVIFAGLGYAGSQGLAFGLIRHAREIAWACLGMALYAVSRRAGPKAPLRPAAGPSAPVR